MTTPHRPQQNQITATRPGSHLTKECPLLDDAEIDKIAERAAIKAMTKMTNNLYQQIGKGVVNKMMWMVGVITVGVWLYLHNKGILK